MRRAARISEVRWPSFGEASKSKAILRSAERTLDGAVYRKRGATRTAYWRSAALRAGAPRYAPHSLASRVELEVQLRRVTEPQRPAPMLRRNETPSSALEALIASAARVADSLEMSKRRLRPCRRSSLIPDRSRGHNTAQRGSRVIGRSTHSKRALDNSSQRTISAEHPSRPPASPDAMITILSPSGAADEAAGAGRGIDSSTG